MIMRMIGLDLGEKRIGVAVSDELGMTAQGRENIIRTSDKETVEAIKKVIFECKASTIVLGYPINMDSSSGDRARDAEKFKTLLETATGIPVVLWDERLTTKEAEAVMLEADVSRAKRRKNIDKLAAQLILQSYLDSSGN